MDLSRSRLEMMLKVLDVDAAVRRVPGGWVTTGRPWSYDAERYARVGAARAAEQQAMRDYISCAGCRMEFLRQQLDDARPPRADAVTTARDARGRAVSPGALAVVREDFARPGADIEPRRMWPTGLPSVGVPLSGRIAAAEQAEPGRILGRLSNIGGDRGYVNYSATASTLCPPIACRTTRCRGCLSTAPFRSTTAEVCVECDAAQRQWRKEYQATYGCLRRRATAALIRKHPAEYRELFDRERLRAWDEGRPMEPPIRCRRDPAPVMPSPSVLVGAGPPASCPHCHNMRPPAWKTATPGAAVRATIWRLSEQAQRRAEAKRAEADAAAAQASGAAERLQTDLDQLRATLTDRTAAEPPAPRPTSHACQDQVSALRGSPEWGI